MNNVYRLRSDKLTPDFIKLLKASYPHKEIEIVVNELMAETKYLMSSPSNRLHLETAMRIMLGRRPNCCYRWQQNIGLLKHIHNNYQENNGSQIDE